MTMGVGPPGRSPSHAADPPSIVLAQVNFLRRQFLQDDGLSFTDILTEDIIAEALAAVGGWLDRIFSPLVTLWVFLGQVLSPDHSCRSAVARLIAHRVARGQRPCSARTGAYCRARQRLPEGFFSAVACSVGRALDIRTDRRWLWKGRRVYLFDGTTVAMPDTPENSGGLSAGLQPGARPWFSDRPHRCCDLAGVRRCREPRVLPIRRQGTGRSQFAAELVVGRARLWRRRSWRTVDIGQLDDHPPAPAARCRPRQPAEQGQSEGGLPPWPSARPPGPHRSLAQADVEIRSLDRAAYRTLPDAITVREARIGSHSRDSGPSRWWW